MKIDLDTLDVEEALRYMGYRGQSMDADMRARLENAKQAVLASSRAAAVFRHTAVRSEEHALLLEDLDMRLPGDALRSHLRGCAGAVLFCVTLGSGVETLIRREMLTDRANALMIDAFAGAAVERACDLLCASLQARFCPPGYTLTTRFSPGYGDTPLVLQRDVCRALDTQKAIGVCVNAGGILTPRKTVTAVAGVRAGREKGKPAGCGNCQECPRRLECPFSSAKREGNTSGQDGDR